MVLHIERDLETIAIGRMLKESVRPIMHSSHSLPNLSTSPTVRPALARYTGIDQP